MATFTGESKNSGSIYNQIKPGQGYPYDSYLTYDELTDPFSGNAVTYNGIGTEPSYTGGSKSAVSSFSNESKS